ncbi:MAG: NAD(P)/FAD-dependent oxidoreductase [Chloroflexi bacterium]|nr:NAD(P)/FAD-dependent oxidoreductase [Chloroflexota bacterium]
MYDLIILGGGPAGLTAAVYALHKRIETLVISEDLGGKTAYRLQLKGLEGHEIISGLEVVEKFKRQLEYLQFAHKADRATKVVPKGNGYSVIAQGSTYEARAVIVATGARPRRLDVPGEKRLMGRGLSYSAISHAQVLIEKQAALYGSSERAIHSAAELAEVAKAVHVILPDKGASDLALGKKLRANPKVKFYDDAQLKEVRGDEFVESVVIAQQGASQEVKVDGLFIEMGLTPNSEVVADFGIVDAEGRIAVNNKCATTKPGVFAAGDVTDVYIEQVLIAIGEGAKAALSAYEYLLNQ